MMWSWVGFGLIYRRPLLGCGDSKHSLKLRIGQIRRGRVCFSFFVFLLLFSWTLVSMEGYEPWECTPPSIWKADHSEMIRYAMVPFISPAYATFSDIFCANQRLIFAKETYGNIRKLDLAWKIISGPKLDLWAPNYVFKHLQELHVETKHY